MEIKKKEEELCRLKQCETFYISNSEKFELKLYQLFYQRMTQAAIICIGVEVVNTQVINQKYGDDGLNELVKIVERQIINFCNREKSKKLECIPYKSRNEKNELNIIFINTNDNNNVTEAKIFASKLLEWIDITTIVIATTNIGISYLRHSDKSSDQWLQRAKRHLIGHKYNDKHPRIIDDLYVVMNHEYSLGNSITLPHGKNGIVKYIGNVNLSTIASNTNTTANSNTNTDVDTNNNTSCSCDEFVIGLELESWDPNGCGGIIGGKKLFDTSSGRAWFINPCRGFAQKYSKQTRKQKCAKFKGLLQYSQLNELRVQLVSWIPQVLRWKVKVVDEKAPHDNVKYYRVRDENLEPLIDVNSTSLNNIESIDDIKIGDTIKIKSGQWGVVQYNGKTFWSNDKKLIGLRLHKWSPNTSDDKVKMTQYFVTDDGHGYFTDFDNIVNVIQNYISWYQERMIWLAFYKNIQNEKCFINELPKDIIKYILVFFGDRVKDEQDPFSS